MKIDKKLNLVMEIDRDDGTKLYVHSTPISREVFETYFMIIGETYTRVFTRLGIASGGRLAALVMKEIAVSNGTWDGDAGVKSGLINEIIRQTNVLVPSQKGWQTVLLDDASTAEMVSEDEFSEVLNAIVFFTLTSSMEKKKDIPGIMATFRRLWGGRLESLNSTEFESSLPMSKGIDSSGVKAAEGSLIPS